MVDIGRYNELTVEGEGRDGLLLGRPPQEVVLPRDECPEGTTVGDRLRVFVYTDSKERLIGSMREAKVQVGEFALLRCVHVDGHGAFLDWGMPKDLFVPFAEQHWRMEEGRSYVVAVCLDKHVDRPMASTKLGPFFDYDLRGLAVGDELAVLVFGHNDAGAQVVVDQRYVGLVYTDATFRVLPVGTEVTGYVAALRGDNRIDISLTRPDTRASSEGRGAAQDAILAALRRGDGFLPLHDKSTPAEIQQRLGLSKTVFKRSAGALYKARLIRIEDDGLHLVESMED